MTDGPFRDDHNLDKIRAEAQIAQKEAELARRELALTKREQRLTKRRRGKSTLSIFARTVIVLGSLGAAVYTGSGWYFVGVSHRTRQ